MARVEIQGIEKRFGDTAVLRGIDLDIADGEFVVLVGESGCGKSTLLRILAGLEQATAGEVRIGGHRVNELEPRERDIAMVFQSYALYPHMSVRGNMGFNLELRGRSPKVIDAAVQSAAGTLSLAQLLDRFPRQLSGGQRQRVAMGRAIVRQPQVFLFDEPLSNLDAKLRVQMRTEIRALHQRLAATSVYVTHDQVEAMTMADRIVVLNHGRIEQTGAPLDLYDRPANLFVARFIGSPAINVLEGSIVERADGFHVQTEAGASLRLNGHGRPPAGRAVAAAFRPEAASVVQHGPINGTVRVFETLGPLSYAYVDVGGRSICCQLPRALPLHAGEPVSLDVAPNAIHLFDRESGNRLASATR
jgi:multiple sugar transport system ATP-binding protein